MTRVVDDQVLLLELIILWEVASYHQLMHTSWVYILYHWLVMTQHGKAPGFALHELYYHALIWLAGFIHLGT